MSENKSEINKTIDQRFEDLKQSRRTYAPRDKLEQLYSEASAENASLVKRHNELVGNLTSIGIDVGRHPARTVLRFPRSEDDFFHEIERTIQANLDLKRSVQSLEATWKYENRFQPAPDAPIASQRGSQGSNIDSSPPNSSPVSVSPLSVGSEPPSPIGSTLSSRTPSPVSDTSSPNPSPKRQWTPAMPSAMQPTPPRQTGSTGTPTGANMAARASQNSNYGKWVTAHYNRSSAEVAKPAAPTPPTITTNPTK